MGLNELLALITFGTFKPRSSHTDIHETQEDWNRLQSRCGYYYLENDSIEIIVII